MTIDEAKKIYVKYDGSLFAMAREEKCAYEGYRELNISIALQKEWRQELFLTLWDQLKITGKNTIFNRMCHVLDGILSKENLFIIKKALNYIEYDDLEIKASVAEAILGRKDVMVRSGIIFGAYDFGEKELAGEFLQFVLNLLKSERADEKIKYRIENDLKKCRVIDEILKLNVSSTNLIS